MTDSSEQHIPYPSTFSELLVLWLKPYIAKASVCSVLFGLFYFFRGKKENTITAHHAKPENMGFIHEDLIHVSLFLHISDYCQKPSSLPWMKPSVSVSVWLGSVSPALQEESFLQTDKVIMWTFEPLFKYFDNFTVCIWIPKRFIKYQLI